MKKIYKNVAYRKCLTQDKEGYLIKSVLGDDIMPRISNSRLQYTLCPGARRALGGKKVIRHSYGLH